MLTWKYNRLGHVELWNGELSSAQMKDRESDHYIQNDQDVDSFFNHIGIDPTTVRINYCGSAIDPGYFMEEA